MTTTLVNAVAVRRGRGLLCARIGDRVVRDPGALDPGARVGESAGQLGLALAFPALGAALSMPLAARVSHRFGTRAALRGLLALWTLALILPSFAPDLLTLCAALLVYGGTAGMADVAMNALGVEIEHRLKKSIMSGLHGMWSVGALHRIRGRDGRGASRISARRSITWSLPSY